MPHSDDLALVERVLTGDRAAFDVLFERLYGPILGHTARKIGRGPLARGAAEASFVALFKRLGRYRGGVSLEAFALTIVRECSSEAARPLASLVPPRPSERAATRV